MFQQSGKAYSNSKRLSLKKSALNEEDERIIKSITKKKPNSSGKNLAPITPISSVNINQNSFSNELIPKKGSNQIEPEKKNSVESGKKE